MSKKRLYIAISVTICVIGSAVFAASQNFRPDVIFKGSSLTGWHKLGQADRARECYEKAKLEKDAFWTKRLLFQRLRQEAEGPGKEAG